MLLADGINQDYFKHYSNEDTQIQQGLKELEELIDLIGYLNIADKVIFNPFLARGLEIYTGTIYEIFLKDQSITSSIGSGGRYDNAIAGLIGTNDTFPTVGISFGLDVIATAIILENKRIKDKSDIDFYVIPIHAQKEALLVARSLRQQGYNVELDISSKKFSKALDRANKENVRQVIIIGEDEVQNNQFKMKDMVSGEERFRTFNFNKF